MSDLKTLKDILEDNITPNTKNNPEGERDIELNAWDISEEIRENAIKWIKDIREAEKDCWEKDPEHYFGEQFDDLIASDGNKGYYVINFIKMFFNITEEEIK